jgi:hypothetical protein
MPEDAETYILRVLTRLAEKVGGSMEAFPPALFQELREDRDLQMALYSLGDTDETREEGMGKFMRIARVLCDARAGRDFDFSDADENAV